MSAGAKKALGDPLLKRFSLAGFEIQGGVKLPAEATLAYRIYGSGPKLAVCGTSYSATHLSLEYHFGTTIDSTAFTFVIFNMLGNGVSFAPSNSDNFPSEAITVRDNVRAQRAALDADPDVGGRSIDLAFGFSMGAMQALEWARFDDVKNTCALCGTSGANGYNRAFLDALECTLSSTSTNQEEKLRNFGAIFAGWFVGPDFYRDEIWRSRGYESVEDFSKNFGHPSWDDGHPADLLAQLRTWHATDPFSADELKAIKGRVLLLPCDNDTYFRVEDLEARELKYLAHCTMNVIKSPWGHLAGHPQKLQQDHKFITDSLNAFLATA